MICTSTVPVVPTGSDGAMGSSLRLIAVSAAPVVLSFRAVPTNSAAPSKRSQVRMKAACPARLARLLDRTLNSIVHSFYRVDK